MQAGLSCASAVLQASRATLRSCPQRARRAAAVHDPPPRDEPLCAPRRASSRPRPDHFGSREVDDDAHPGLPRVTRSSLCPKRGCPRSARAGGPTFALTRPASPTRMTQTGRLRPRGLAWLSRPHVSRLACSAGPPCAPRFSNPARRDPPHLPRFSAPPAPPLARRRLRLRPTRARKDARDLPRPRRARGPHGHRPRRLLVHRRVRRRSLVLVRSLESREADLAPPPPSLQLPVRVRPLQQSLAARGDHELTLPLSHSYDTGERAATPPFEEGKGCAWTSC